MIAVYLQVTSLSFPSIIDDLVCFSHEPTCKEGRKSTGVRPDDIHGDPDMPHQSSMFRVGRTRSRCHLQLKQHFNILKLSCALNPWFLAFGYGNYLLVYSLREVDASRFGPRLECLWQVGNLVSVHHKL